MNWRNTKDFFPGLAANFILLLFTCFSALAGNVSVKNIPDEIKENADAVMREHHTTIEVQNLNKANIKVKSVVTVLNEEGKTFGHFYGAYYHNQRFRRIKAEVFDSNGNRIRRLKNSEIIDRSYVSGISLFEDTRIKTFEVHHPTYPYTVVLEYEKDYQGFAGFPRWIPQQSGNISVQNASLTLLYPEENPVRFKTLNMDQPVAGKADQGYINFQWQVSNLLAFKNEPLSVAAHEYLPYVYLSPGDFYFHNTSGNLQTWKNYGEWVAALLQGRQELPELIVKEITELTKEISDNPREVARRVYEFMQNQTRYVSIQLGLGGFQPFPADVVANTGYGDCKALSNYTMALLRVVGIESFYSEIGAGRRYIHFEDFPSLDQTNHAILCVPFESDTVWLECTSQRLPFGYVPQSLQYRKALVVNQDNSGIVNMPAYRHDDNRMELLMDIELDIAGNALAVINTTYKGIQIEEVFPEVWQSSKEQHEALALRYTLPGGVIGNFTMALFDEELFAKENLEIAITSFGAKTGRRMFINAYPLGHSESRMQKVEERKTDFEIRFPYHDQEIFRIIFPDTFMVENIPDPVEHKTTFGEYRMQTLVEGNVVQITRELTINNGRFPAREYNDYVDFHQAIYRSDRNQVVLVERE
jgi:hypothetical protein